MEGIREDGRRVTGGEHAHICARRSLEDLRYAARLLRRQPGFAATTILTLALGLGSATAIFAWVDRMFLKLLSVHEPDRMLERQRMRC
jgi:hypothetical protein